MTSRRSFFAAVAAPIIARFLPKPKSMPALFNSRTEIPTHCATVYREGGHTFYRLDFEPSPDSVRHLKEAFINLEKADAQWRKDWDAELDFFIGQRCEPDQPSGRPCLAINRIAEAIHES